MFPGNKFNKPYTFEETSPAGLKMVSRLIDCLETPDDVWLAYELGSKTLGHRLFDIRMEQRLKGD